MPSASHNRCSDAGTPLYRFMVYLMPNQGSGCAVELNNVLAWISRTFMLIVLPLGQTVFPPASSTLAPQASVAPERRPPPLADGGADQHSLMAHGEQGVAAGRVKQGIQRPRGGTLRWCCRRCTNLDCGPGRRYAVRLRSAVGARIPRARSARHPPSARLCPPGGSDT